MPNIVKFTAIVGLFLIGLVGAAPSHAGHLGSFDPRFEFFPISDNDVIIRWHNPPGHSQVALICRYDYVRPEINEPNRACDGGDAIMFIDRDGDRGKSVRNWWHLRLANRNGAMVRVHLDVFTRVDGRRTGDYNYFPAPAYRLIAPRFNPRLSKVTVQGQKKIRVTWDRPALSYGLSDQGSIGYRDFRLICWDGIEDPNGLLYFDGPGAVRMRLINERTCLDNLEHNDATSHDIAIDMDEFDLDSAGDTSARPGQRLVVAVFAHFHRTENGPLGRLEEYAKSIVVDNVREHPYLRARPISHDGIAILWRPTYWWNGRKIRRMEVRGQQNANAWTEGAESFRLTERDLNTGYPGIKNFQRYNHLADTRAILERDQPEPNTSEIFVYRLTFFYHGADDETTNHWDSAPVTTRMYPNDPETDPRFAAGTGYNAINLRVTRLRVLEEVQGLSALDETVARKSRAEAELTIGWRLPDFLAAADREDDEPELRTLNLQIRLKHGYSNRVQSSEWRSHGIGSTWRSQTNSFNLHDVRDLHAGATYQVRLRWTVEGAGRDPLSRERAALSDPIAVVIPNRPNHPNFRARQLADDRVLLVWYDQEHYDRPGGAEGLPLRRQEVSDETDSHTLARIHQDHVPNFYGLGAPQAINFKNSYIHNVDKGCDTRTYELRLFYDRRQDYAAFPITHSNCADPAWTPTVQEADITENSIRIRWNPPTWAYGDDNSPDEAEADVLELQRDHDLDGRFNTIHNPEMVGPGEYLVTELEPGQTYHFRMRTAFSEVSGNSFNAEQRRWLHSAVLEVQTRSSNMLTRAEWQPDEGRVRLEWNAAGYAPGSVHRVLRKPCRVGMGGCTAANRQTQFGLVGQQRQNEDGDNNNFDDRVGHGLWHGVAYEYRIDSTPAGMDASMHIRSNTRSVTVPAGRPESPVLWFSGISQDRIAVNWQTPWPGGPEITGYTVQRKLADDEDAEFAAVEPAHTGTDPTYVDTGLAQNTAYTYRVRATNDLGDSAWAIATTNTGEIPVSGDASQLTAVLTPEGLRLSWRVFSTRPLRSHIERRLRDTSGAVSIYSTVETVREIVHPGNPITRTLTDLGGPGNWEYRVRQEYSNSHPDRPNFFRETEHITVRLESPPSPSSAFAGAIRARDILVEWTAPTETALDPSLHGAVIGYRILRNGAVIVPDHPATETTFTDTGLALATDYRYQIHTLTHVGVSLSPKTTATVRTQGAGELFATPVPNGLRIDWRVFGSTRPAATRIQRRRVGESNAVTVHTDRGRHFPGTDLSHTLTNSGGPGNWEYRIQQEHFHSHPDRPNFHLESTWLPVTLELPPAPMNLRATLEGDSTINLAWEPPLTDPRTQGPVIGYRLMRGTTEIAGRYPAADCTLPDPEDTEASQVTTCDFADTGLGPATTYAYKIYTITPVGVGIAAAQGSEATPAVAPDAPAAPTLSVLGRTSIQIAWAAPANNGGASITGYELQRATGAHPVDGDFAAVTRDNALAVTHADEDLTPNTPYAYRVQARNPSGNSAWSVAATATTEALPGTPTADAGAPQTVMEGELATLSGGGTDPNGDDAMLAFAWTQLPGTPPVTLSDASAQNPTFTAPDLAAETVLTFALTVRDAEGLDSPPDTVTVTVQAADDPPTASASAAATVEEGTLVNLTGGGTDPDGDDNALNFAWTQTAGTPTVELLPNANAQNPNFFAPQLTADTVFTFSLVVNDGNMDSAAATVTITVTADDDPPVADAGMPQSADEGDTVTLNGGGSSDPEGQTITYLWSQTAGTPTVTLSDTTAQSPTFTAPEFAADMDLTFSLVVNDDTSDSDAATVVITIAADDDPPTADAGDPQNVNDGDTVTLTGGGTDPDTAPADLNFRWTQTDGMPTVDFSPNANAQNPTFTAPQLDADTAFTFSLVVNDGTTNSAADTVVITIQARNDPPTATAGAVESTVEENNMVRLMGEGTDPDGDDNALSFTWTQTAGTPMVTLSDTTAQSPTFTAPQLVANTALTFALVVNDGNRDSAADTETITITADDDPPTAEAGAPQSAAEGDTVTLNGGGSSDPEGQTLTYLWSQAAGTPTVTLSPNANAQNPTFTAPELAADVDLTFSLVVNDGNMDSAADTVVITITADDDAPVAAAGATQNVNDGETVTLTGGGTDQDGDDDALTFTWTQTAGTPTVELLPNANARSPTFTAPELDTDTTFAFSLVVNDGNMDSAASTVQIHITAEDDRPTASASADPPTASAGEMVALRGSGSDPDTPEAIMTYVWSWEWMKTTAAGVAPPPVVLSPDANAQNPTFIAPELTVDAELIFTLTVNDGNSDSDPVTVNIAIEARDNTAEALDKSVLPKVLHNFERGIYDSIFQRIQRRQRADGKWK